MGGRVHRLPAAVLAAVLALALIPAPAAAEDGAPAAETLGLYDPVTSTWYLRDAAGATATREFGAAGSLPVTGDWDGDGVDSVGVYNPATGLLVRDGAPTAMLTAGGVPLAGDIDGDGRDEVQVLGGGLVSSAWETVDGASRALVADLDGDGRDELVVEADGGWWADGARVALPAVDETDRVVVGDWDGDGVPTAAVYRPRTAEFWVYGGAAVADGVTIVPYGSSRMLPVAGRFGEVAGSAVAPPRVIEIPSLASGDQGAAVVRLQSALAGAGLYRGPIDGVYGQQTAAAVMAFRKALGLDRVWAWDAAYTETLASFEAAGFPDRPDEPDRIEVDVGRQVMFLILDGAVEAVVPVSTGGGYTYYSKRALAYVRANTPRGDFTLLRGLDGWSYDPLYGWSIYKPWNFTKAYAIHGYTHVPEYPASHGCVRIPNWEADALTPLFYVGMPVHVWDVMPVMPAEPAPPKLLKAPPVE